MRLLFTFAGGTGHFVPLGALATAAAAAGHEVAFACQSGMLSVVQAAGFVAFDTGGPTLLSQSTRAPLLELDPEREDRAITFTFAGKVARERAGKLRVLCADWRPDVLVRDEVDFGTAVIAEALNIPHANVLVIASGSFVRNALIAEPLNRLRAEYQLSPDPELCMLSRDLVLAPFPPTFRDPAFLLPQAAHSLRPLSLERPAPVPDVHDAIYATLGTIFNLESGDLFERILHAMAQLEHDVVLTVGNEVEPGSVGPVPPRVHVAHYIPQSALLPRCCAVVSHAGSGSIMGALAHGLPSVLLPMGADQPQNAARCAALGTGRVLDAVHASPVQIRDAVMEILANPAYRAAAQRFREEILSLPRADQAISLLENLAK